MKIQITQLKNYQSIVKEWLKVMAKIKNEEVYEQKLLQNIAFEIDNLKLDNIIKDFPYDLLYFPLIHLRTSLNELKFASNHSIQMKEIERIYLEMEVLLANINIYIDYYLYKVNELQK
ncbi:hypothetical protein CHL76_11820 [Marinococcus halophilus]|uniref:Uncharacterized protein n=1 Tax=Marinococcus halophilus TaxID=1371 RepID=A0A510Y7Y3_MARHA|nr:hypothetical protein [Marinococcus halophilus]OZT79597.1 hypothetical protein CHL76_11820 [Marinococcus halophilus]GEK59469.1 hypothetical protein MHA01_23740 [Marinococcus halophilus]